MVVLAWRNMPYTAKRLKIISRPKKTRSPEFTLINPRCKPRTLVDSDVTIVIESMAILQYLEHICPHSIYEATELLYDLGWQRHRESILQA